MPREVSVTWSSTLVCGARLSQQWAGPCLSYTSEVIYSTLLGLFDKCLGTPDAKWGVAQEPMGATWVLCLTSMMVSVEFPQKPTCGWSRSADLAVLITRADILGVSSCQMCLL